MQALGSQRVGVETTSCSEAILLEVDLRPGHNGETVMSYFDTPGQLANSYRAGSQVAEQVKQRLGRREAFRFDR